MKTQEEKTLKTWSYVREIMSIKDCQYSTAIIYSYMLAKYQWHKTHGREFFEGQELISEMTLVALRTVKDAIKFLKLNGLLRIEKVKTGTYSKNQYVVVDRFGAYLHLEPTEKPKKSTPKKKLFNPEEEEVCPF